MSFDLDEAEFYEAINNKDYKFLWSTYEALQKENDRLQNEIVDWHDKYHLIRDEYLPDRINMSLLNTRTSFKQHTNQFLMNKLKEDGWKDPFECWNLNYQSAMRMYHKNNRPIKIYYEGIYWFTYNEVI